jgi:hypothetical protein
LRVGCSERWRGCHHLISRGNSREFKKIILSQMVKPRADAKILPSTPCNDNSPA